MTANPYITHRTEIIAYLKLSHRGYHVKPTSGLDYGKGVLVLFTVTPKDEKDRWLHEYQRVAYFTVTKEGLRGVWDNIAD